MDGGGIAEHVGAVAENGHHWALRARKLGAERGAGAPTETRRGTRSEIEIRKLEGAMVEEQRVLGDCDVAGKAADRVARKQGIESALDDLAVRPRRGPAWNPRDVALEHENRIRVLHQSRRVETEIHGMG